MNNVIRPVATLLLVLICITTLFSFGKQEMYRRAEQELSYALRVATQDATDRMMDKNHLFGNDWASQVFATDISAATKQFKASFRRNTASGRITDVDVSFAGIATQWAVYGLYSNGTPTPAFGYTFYRDLDPLNVGDRTRANTLYEFSLGDSFRELNLTTNISEEKKLSELPANYFGSKVSNRSFQNIAVMSSINGFLNTFYSNEIENVSVRNAGTGLEFNLGLFDYSDDDLSILSSQSAMIDGPGYFAVVDYYDVFLDQRARVFSISSAEMVCVK